MPFKLYKGDSVSDEGESPLEITGLDSGTEVEKGEYEVVRVEDGKESDRVDVPAFETLTTTTTTTEPTTTTTTTESTTTSTTTEPTTTTTTTTEAPTTTTTEEPTTTTTTTDRKSTRLNSSHVSI